MLLQTKATSVMHVFLFFEGCTCGIVLLRLLDTKKTLPRECVSKQRMQVSSRLTYRAQVKAPNTDAKRSCLQDWFAHCAAGRVKVIPLPRSTHLRSKCKDPRGSRRRRNMQICVKNTSSKNGTRREFKTYLTHICNATRELVFQHAQRAAKLSQNLWRRINEI